MGILATALLLSGVFGWPLLLQPIANAMGPGVSPNAPPSSASARSWS
jgi:hypothetical protein